MGLFDKAKDLAGQHADKVGDAIDKAADMVDEKTGGKYADHIDKGAEAAKGFVDGDGERVVVDDAEGHTAPPRP
ncbi:MAG TPA: antitoxin [Acidimicrobiales bacterium]|nr:antitoxin [Acidimicrobiales bacterium]